MKRLTGRNRSGDLLFRGEQVYAGDFYEATAALENYEKTMCTPEEINALKAENQYLRDDVAVMREALKPFAAYGKLYKDLLPGHPVSIKTDTINLVKAYIAFIGVKEADNDQHK